MREIIITMIIILNTILTRIISMIMIIKTILIMIISMIMIIKTILIMIMVMIIIMVMVSQFWKHAGVELGQNQVQFY